MINCNIRRKRNGVPIMTYEQIDNIAIALIQDYDRSLLKKPKAIDIEDFLEFYLGLKIGYADLTHNQSILGTIALTNGTYITYDKEHNSIFERTLKAGDVLIDNILLEKRSERRRNFTIAHEAGHYITLKPLIDKYKEESRYLSNNNLQSNVIQCSAKHLNYGGGKPYYKRKTNEEWREYYADNMGAALLMPKPTVGIVANDIFVKYNIEKQIVLNVNNNSTIAAYDLSENIAKIFNVSKQAASIRLKKLKYIIDNNNNNNLNC